MVPCCGKRMAKKDAAVAQGGPARGGTKWESRAGGGAPRRARTRAARLWQAGVGLGVDHI